ncbi:MAG: saccharopine dehydrogenase NADP-binding domain-containing protein [Anaerolineales bacterium]|nr:saccharopine dehydrogenase NADP-binding domain-containing protein [Anaerolineales bacterium]
MRILVLGTGLVGQAIVRDLADHADFEILAVDQNPDALDTLPVDTRCFNLQEADLTDLSAGFDLVVNAVPGSMGFSVLEQLVQTGIRVVDIAFSPEDPFALDGVVRKHESLAVVDCGVAPGLCNIFAGYCTNLFEKFESYRCYVGGLPAVRRWPYQYGAVFSPSDVIEEYTRPVYILEAGEEVVREPLSGVEWLDFPEVGTLEAFYTDGLRTLRYTMDIPCMYEKTLRYPGHAELMRIFRESGFFGREKITINGTSIQPLAVSTHLLRQQWKMKPEEQDLTIMRVCVTGRTGAQRKRITFDLFDRNDSRTGISSMARTTGYTCTAVVRLIADGCDLRGICPPEWLGKNPEFFESIAAYLKERNVTFRIIEEELLPAER